MKKLLSSLAIVLILVLSACSSSKEGPDPEKGTGNLEINTSVKALEKSIISTRSVDYDQFAVFLDGTEVTLPEDRTIKDLEVKEYNLEVRSRGEMAVPNFGIPYYMKALKVTPVEEQTIPVEVVLDQKNAAIKFDYSELDGSGLDIIPVLTQRGTDLEFKDANKDATGYFAIESVVFTVKDAATGDPVKIDGEESQTIDRLKENYELTIKLAPVVDPETTGIAISIRYADLETETITFTIGGEDEEEPFEPEFFILEELFEYQPAKFISSSNKFAISMRTWGQNDKEGYTLILQGQKAGEIGDDPSQVDVSGVYPLSSSWAPGVLFAYDDYAMDSGTRGHIIEANSSSYAYQLLHYNCKLHGVTEHDPRTCGMAVIEKNGDIYTIKFYSYNMKKEIMASPYTKTDFEGPLYLKYEGPLTWSKVFSL